MSTQFDDPRDQALFNQAERDYLFDLHADRALNVVAEMPAADPVEAADDDVRAWTGVLVLFGLLLVSWAFVASIAVLVLVALMRSGPVGVGALLVIGAASLARVIYVREKRRRS